MWVLLDIMGSIKPTAILTNIWQLYNRLRIGYWGIILPISELYCIMYSRHCTKIITIKWQGRYKLPSTQTTLINIS